MRQWPIRRFGGCFTISHCFFCNHGGFYIRMNAARTAKGHVVAQKRPVLQPQVPAGRHELHEAHALHLVRAGRRHHAQQRHALPGIVGQAVGGRDAGVREAGQLEAHAQLGEALGDFVEEARREGEGAVDEELVVCGDGHDGGDFMRKKSRRGRVELRDGVALL